MLKHSSLLILVFSFFIGLMAPALSMAGSHVVQYGDTLWDLAMRFYRNHEYWEVIYEANEIIADPHWIFPGQVLLIPETDYGYTTYTPLSTTTLSSQEAVISRLRLETTGMVAVDPVVANGYIVDIDAEEPPEYSSLNAYTGDLLHTDIGTDKGVEIGRVYHILKQGDAVHHPENGSRIGEMIWVAGVCRIVETSPSSSVALVEHSYMPINDGDMLVPYCSAAPVVINSFPVMETMTAWVIEIQDPDVDNAFAYDVVFIDKGYEDGLNPGDIFNVFNYGDVQISPVGESVVTMDIPVAELVIIRTERKTSAALISVNRTCDLIQVGDQIHLVRRQES